MGTFFDHFFKESDCGLFLGLILGNKVGRVRGNRITEGRQEDTGQAVGEREREAVAEVVVDDIDHLRGGVVTGVLDLQRGFVVFRENLYVGFTAKNFENGADEVKTVVGNRNRDETEFGGIVRGGNIGFLKFVQLRIRENRKVNFRITEGRVFQGRKSLVAEEQRTAFRDISKKPVVASADLAPEFSWMKTPKVCLQKTGRRFKNK